MNASLASEQEDAIYHRHYSNVQYYADKKMTPKGLLLRLMAKELLAHYRPRPSAHQPKNKQRHFRDSVPGPAGRHFIDAINRQRQRVNK